MHTAKSKLEVDPIGNKSIECINVMKREITNVLKLAQNENDE